MNDNTQAVVLEHKRKTDPGYERRERRKEWHEKKVREQTHTHTLCGLIESPHTHTRTPPANSWPPRRHSLRLVSQRRQSICVKQQRWRSSSRSARSKRLRTQQTRLGGRYDSEKQQQRALDTAAHAKPSTCTTLLSGLQPRRHGACTREAHRRTGKRTKWWQHRDRPALWSSGRYSV